jgi:hypothetical protein
VPLYLSMERRRADDVMTRIETTHHVSAAQAGALERGEAGKSNGGHPATVCERKTMRLVGAQNASGTHGRGGRATPHVHSQRVAAYFFLYPSEN